MGIVIFRTKLNFYICLIRSSFSGDHRVIVACDNAATLIACTLQVSHHRSPIFRTEPSPLVWSTNIKISAISGPGPLVPWSPGPLVPFSQRSQPSQLPVPWSPGPLVPFSQRSQPSQLPVPWSPGPLWSGPLISRSCKQLT